MQANIEEEGFKEPPTEIVHRERMKELMCFLWDNYLEMHESEHIVLMGVGDSYIGVRELLVNRGKAASLSLSSCGHTLTSPPRIKTQNSPRRCIRLRLSEARAQ